MALKLQSQAIEIGDGEDAELAFEYAIEQGWSDGLPIIPPTQDRVARMMAATERRPDEVVATIAPRYGEATVERAAINAVMAGCHPSYFPILLAALEAVSDPAFKPAAS